jgi:hypothetical protein
MSDSTRDADGTPVPEALLEELDPFLNVFALANGLDLDKDPPDPPARLLGWYRDGMERFLRLEPEQGATGRLLVWAEAIQKRDGRTHRGRRPVQGPLAGESLHQDLRAVLERGIEQANALGPGDLQPVPADTPGPPS